MKSLLAILALLLVLPAWAETQSLRGQWRIMAPRDPSYSGDAQMDAEGRITWVAKWDPEYRVSAGLKPGTGRANSRGYLRTALPNVEIILTDSVEVERHQCVLQSSDLLYCSDRTFVLTRIGPGPASLVKPSQ